MSVIWYGGESGEGSGTNHLGTKKKCVLELITSKFKISEDDTERLLEAFEYEMNKDKLQPVLYVGGAGEICRIAKYMLSCCSRLYNHERRKSFLVTA